jgi:hypothetical protein
VNFDFFFVLSSLPKDRRSQLTSIFDCRTLRVQRQCGRDYCHTLPDRGDCCLAGRCIAHAACRSELLLELGKVRQQYPLHWRIK